MSETLLQPTRPTPNAGNVLSLVNSTANHSDGGVYGIGSLTASIEVRFNVGHSPAGPSSSRLVGKTGTNSILPHEYYWIEDLREDEYRVLQPIRVRVKRIGLGNFEASFPEANISISGIHSDDAYQALVAEILDTFDILNEEAVLGPAASDQLRILRTYIAKA